MEHYLESIFSRLKGSNYRVSSPATPTYNCIAFAAGRDDRWWWPGPFSYWPAGVPKDETLEAFVLAFGTLGYTVCDDGLPEVGFEKVAIYADRYGTPTHMARQLNTGIWVSKCGELEDIEHDTLEALEGHAGE